MLLLAATFLNDRNPLRAAVKRGSGGDPGRQVRELIIWG